MKDVGKNILYILFLFFLSAINSNLYAQKLDFNVSKTSLHVGESVDLSFRVELPEKGTKVSFASTENYLKKYFDIISASEMKKNEGGIIVYEKKYKCLFLLVQDVILKPPVDILKDNNKIKKYFPERKIKFLPLIKGKPDIKYLRDIKAPFFFAVKNKKLFMWGIVFIAFVLLVLILLFLWKRYKFKKKKKKVDEIPYWVEVLRKINAMRGYELNNFPQAKKLCYELSMILRRYIEKRFSISAPNKTSEEFLQELSHSKYFDVYYKSLLKGFIKLSDRVKYSGYLPSKKELNDLIDSAEVFVKKTIPVNDLKKETENQNEIKGERNDRV